MHAAVFIVHFYPCFRIVSDIGRDMLNLKRNLIITEGKILWIQSFIHTLKTLRHFVPQFLIHGIENLL